jgi:hypothetical protein
LAVVFIKTELLFLSVFKNGRVVKMAVFLQEVEEVSVVAEEPIPQIHQPYNQLSVTCPDGLHVKFMLQSALGINTYHKQYLCTQIKSYFGCFYVYILLI